MAKISNPFRYRYRGLPDKEAPSVYKIWLDDHYYIWKGKSLDQSVLGIASSMDRYIRKGPTPTEAERIGKMMEYVLRARPLFFEVEVLHSFAHDLQAHTLLTTEQIELSKAKNDPMCLNMVFDAYIPKWIPEQEIELYNRWLARWQGQLNK